MRRYLLERAGFAAATVFVAVSVNFLLFRVLPGSAVSRLSRVPNASPEVRQALEREFGLDRPLWEQYLRYLGQLARGNLGVSYANRQPVLDNLLDALGATIPLVATGTVLAVVVGTAAGVLAAVRRGTVVDHTTTGLAVVLYAFPTQFLGMAMVILLAGTLPSMGVRDPFLLHPTAWDSTVDALRHLVLPLVTLVMTLYAEELLIVRSAVLDTLGEDYVLTGRAKGLSRWRIIRDHAFRNALLPTVTQVALSLGSIVGGSILIEVIFSWPGIGSELYDAVLARDYPMLQGGFLMITVAAVLFNLVADALYARLDPRVVS